MPRFRFALGFLTVALGMAATPSPDTSPVETKLRKLEMRSIRRDPYRGISGHELVELCRSRKRVGGGTCRTGPMRRLLEYAFRTDPLRIVGPHWMQDDDFYMFYYEYDVEKPCPTTGRSLDREIFREILVEEFSLAVRREEGEAPVLVMQARPGQALLSFSKSDICSIDDAPVYEVPRSTGGGGLGPGISSTGPDNPSAHAVYQAEPPFAGMTNPNITTYRGCTLAELGIRLKYRLPVEIADETATSTRHDFTLSSSKPEDAVQQLAKQLGIDAHIEKRRLPFVVLDAPSPPRKIKYEAQGPVPAVAPAP